MKARDAQAYAAWGAALLQVFAATFGLRPISILISVCRLQLSSVSNGYEKKLEFLRQSRDKLTRAVDINPKSTTPEQLLAVLEVIHPELPVVI